MQIIEIIVHETIWGGNKLTAFSGSDCVKIGHLYSAIDTKEFCNKIISGKDKGKNLHEWFLENRDIYGLGNFKELPISLAMVDAREDLSVQLHPDDYMARKIENMPFGKNESFYVIEAPTCGKMYNGCKGTSIEDFKEKITNGKIDEVLDMIFCQEGDYVYITAGTLHAATAGSLLFEVEENCNKTYRIWDYDRLDKNGNKRPLHLEKALECIDISKKSIPRRYKDDEQIEERMYYTRYIKDKVLFRNEGYMFSFAVMLKGDKVYDGVRVLPGTAILLEEEESFDVSDAEWIIVTPKRFRS